MKLYIISVRSFYRASTRFIMRKVICGAIFLLDDNIDTNQITPAEYPTRPLNPMNMKSLVVMPWLGARLLG